MLNFLSDSAMNASKYCFTVKAINILMLSEKEYFQWQSIVLTQILLESNLVLPVIPSSDVNIFI